MELKLMAVINSLAIGKLLIVLYGIETEKFRGWLYSFGELLIVPYGIETAKSPHERRDY